MKRVKRTLIALTISGALTACGGHEPPRTVNSACLAFKPISYANAPAGAEKADDLGNRYDTPETIAEIDEHDAVYERLCVNR